MTWVVNNAQWIAELVWLHLWLSVSAILVSVLIAVPVGWLVNRHQLTRDALIALISVIYAVPSLPMFIVIPAITGVSIRSAATVVIVLSIYGVALLQRSAADAFAAVPQDVLDSATALGYSPWQKFWRIELPLAGSIIIAGLRVVVVNTVSLVTVGAVIGIQSIGSLFTDGFQRGIIAEVVTGLVLTIVLALVLDALTVLAGWLLFPWKRAERVGPGPLVVAGVTQGEPAGEEGAR